MKKIIYISLSILCLAGISSCEKYGENITTPEVSITVTPQNPKVGETVTITVKTDGQYATLYTGDESHMYERSRIKAIIENDWESFKDTCYRVSYAKNGEAETWNRYFKDYSSLDEVKKDFEFFGAISDVELIPYNDDDFPEAMLKFSYPGTNQLHFKVTDRKIRSGIRVKPNIHLLGGADNRTGASIIESRYVACDEDMEVRNLAHSYTFPAYFGVHTEQINASEEHPKGYTQEYIGACHEWSANPTHNPLSGRPTEGYYLFCDLYNGNSYLQWALDHGEDVVMRTLDIYSTYRVTDEGNYEYDLDGDGIMEKYACELNPKTGLPVNVSDYSKYKGFQGDVYLSFLELGSKEYEPWNTGVSLGSVYNSLGITETYQYTYNAAGKFTVTVVATNIGNKQHQLEDYATGRDNSLDNYPALRTVQSVDITVCE